MDNKIKTGLQGVLRRIRLAGEKILTYPTSTPDDGLIYWQERIFYYLLLSVLVLGSLAYIPSIVVSVEEELWVVVVVDTLALILFYVIAFSRKIPFELKVKAALSIFYLLGILLLLFLGPLGAGYIYLFAFGIIPGMLLGMKDALRAVVLNALALTIMGVFIHFELLKDLYLHKYIEPAWWVNEVNFVFLNTLTTISLGVIIRGLNKIYQQQRNLNELLEKEREALSIAKDKAEAADQLKSSFVANLSHELRTPLNAVIGYAQLLESKNKDEEQKSDYVSNIKSNSQYLVNLINDILDLSKVEANHIDLKLNAFSMLELFEALHNETQILAKSKNSLDVVLNIKTPQFDNFVSDELRVRQILNNLLSNAVKFTEFGRITFGYEYKEGLGFEIYVRDTGKGIPEDEQEFIFDRFHKGHKSRQINKEGTGLGLAITKSLVELLGGTVSFNSVYGKGTEFIVFLPDLNEK